MAVSYSCRHRSPTPPRADGLGVKEHLSIADGVSDCSDDELRVVLALLIDTLGYNVFRTNETQQGRKHGIVEIILEKREP